MSRALIAQLADALQACADNAENPMETRDALLAAIEHLAAPEQSEPVAWQHKGTATICLHYKEGYEPAGEGWRPLYTHPAPQPTSRHPHKGYAMTPTPNTNAEALRLAQALNNRGEENGILDTAAAMLRAQAQEIATLRDERDAFCTEVDVLRVALTAQAQEIERLRSIVPEVLEELNDQLCDENDTLRTENERLRAALEAECGGRCNAEYNPCAARAALKDTK